MDALSGLDGIHFIYVCCKADGSEASTDMDEAAAGAAAGRDGSPGPEQAAVATATTH
jgi:hypothetical protein